MIRIRRVSLWLMALVMGSGIGLLGPTHSSAANKVDADKTKRIQESYGKLPLSFEVNQGQTDPAVKFLARGPGYGLFLTPNEAVLALTRPTGAKEPQTEATLVRMQLVGAKAKPSIVGLDPLPGQSHYFIGNDPKQWHTGVALYGKVKYQSVYPGIDLIYYGNQQQLEYDLVVAPGADPKKIRLAFQGVKGLRIDTDGRLVLDTGDGTLIQHKPIVYQEINGERKLLDGRYVLKGKEQVGFQVAKYDRKKPLVIDPVLAYSTYLGSSCPTWCPSDLGTGIAVDADGNAFLTGRTIGFPVTPGAYDQVCGSPSGQYGVGGCVHIIPSSDCSPCTLVYRPDAFVAKLNATGTGLVYATYLGAGGTESGTAIAVDADGNAYVTGSTNSIYFPVTSGAIRTTCGCGTYVTDAFVSKLNPTGSALVYSTFLAGSGNDVGYGIALDGSGNAYVTGMTASTDFHSVNAMQSSNGGGNDAFVAKLNATGTALLYSTYLGGTGNDEGRGIAVKSDGSASLVGSTASPNFSIANAYQSAYGVLPDAFLTTLSATGTLSSSTYLGGNGADYGYGIALDGSGNAYVTGSTASTDFPTTTTPVNGAFATKFTSSGSALAYSTSAGGSAGYGIAVNSSGNASITGANGNDAFVTKLTADGSGQVYTFAIGGSGVDSGNAIALDGDGNAYVVGSTSSPNLPTTPSAVQEGGGVFVSKVAEAAAVRFSSATYSANEAAGSVTLTVERIGSSSGVVSVDYATSNGDAQAGSDYTGSSGTISFADGDMTPKTFSVSLIDDSVEEPNETFTVTLSNVQGGYLNKPATATVTITNDDIWSRLQFNAASYTRGEGEGYATITVTRTTSSVGAVTVNYQTSDGSAVGGAGPLCAAGEDYLDKSGTVSFADGDTTPKTFYVTICNDSVEEANDSLTITLTNPTGPAFVGTPGAATLTIYNNDETLRFSSGGYTIGEEGGSATITVTRTGETSTYGVTVDYATSDGSAQAGSDYTAASGTLSFGAGVTSRTFTVPILNTDDGQAGAGEPYETVILTLSNLTGDGPVHGAMIGSPNPSTLTIVDNDPSDQPTISNIAATNITSNSARITWTTNQTSDSTVEYGTSTAYGSTVYQGGLVTSHSVNLTGLSYSTLYHYRVKSRNGSGQLAISEDQTFETPAAPPPTVTSTSISSVTYGVTSNSSVTIYGSNFMLGATITVGSLSGPTVAGSTASATTPFVFVNSTTLRFWWPNASLAPGAYDVVVTNPDAASASLTNGFTVVAPQPTISSLAANTATYGVTSSQQINIYGTNFVLGATVTVGSLSGATVSGSSATASVPYVYVNSSTLRFWWPNTSLAPGPYAVQVTNPAGAGGLSASLADGFSVVAPQPTISSISPPSVTYGVTASSQVTIYGTNFVLGATVTVGSLSGATVSGSSATASVPYVYVNSSTLRFWWPNTSLTPGAHTVAVVNPVAAGALDAALAGGFTVVAPQPTVSTVTASTVTYGVTASQSVTIAGSNFVLGATITVGSLSGATVSGSSATATVPYVHSSSGTVRFWWPNTALAPGAYTVTVTNPAAAGGLGASLANAFTVNAPQPTVSTVTASAVTYGVSPNQSVTISGTNFVLGAIITVGSLSGATVSGSSATATVPYVYSSSGMLRFWWPNTALAPGAYTVTVTNPAAAGGLSASLASAFTVNAPQPTVSTVTASAVTYGVSPNQSVTISGTNFVLGAIITVGSLSGATVSGSSATATVPYVYSSSGMLRFWWPNTALAPGAYTVTVTNPAAAGGLSASLTGGFTVNPPQPTVTSVSPSPVAYGVTSSRSITVSGANFVVGSTITVQSPLGSLSGVTVSGSNATATTPFVFTTSGNVKFWWNNTSLPVDSYDVTITNPSIAGGLAGTLADGFVVQ